MLCLTRKVGEEILIGPDIRVVIGDIRRDQVKLRIEAPKDVRILRRELAERKEEQAADER